MTNSSIVPETKNDERSKQFLLAGMGNGIFENRELPADTAKIEFRSGSLPKQNGKRSLWKPISTAIKFLMLRCEIFI